jgi:hypothetical protein
MSEVDQLKLRISQLTDEMEAMKKAHNEQIEADIAHYALYKDVCLEIINAYYAYQEGDDQWALIEKMLSIAVNGKRALMGSGTHKSD